MSAGQRSNLVRDAVLRASLLGPLQLAFIIATLGAIRAGYDPWQQSISELAIGPNGWILQASLLGCGVVQLGLRWVIRGLATQSAHLCRDGPLMVASLGLVALGIFPSYRDQPPIPAFLHILAFGVTGVALIVACLALPHTLRGIVPPWFQRYSRGTAIGCAALFLVLVVHASTVVLHMDSPLKSMAGGVERLGVGMMGLWLELLPLTMLLSRHQMRTPLQEETSQGEE